MSVSANMKGGKRSEMKKPLQAHQVRVNEKEGRKALKYTDSAINPELTKMNINYFDDPNRFEEMREKIDKMSKVRQEQGGRKVYNTANVFMMGTLQIGDNSLELLGWKFENGKKLPADQQSDRALDNVKLVYKNMIASVKSQPEIYGDVFSATLHFDEGSPHVDFLSDPLDVSRPYELAGHYLNGPKGTPKGKNLSRMQDNLMKNVNLKKEDLEKFDLKRGQGKSDRLNTARELRAKERQLSEKEKELNTKVKSLDEEKSSFKGFEQIIREREEEAKEAEQKAKKQALRASEQLEKASMLAKLSKSLVDTYERISEKVKRGIIRPKDLVDTENRAKEELKPFDHSNPEHLQSLSDALEDLEEDNTQQL